LSKIRVHELATELGTTSKEILLLLREEGIELRGSTRFIDEEIANKIRNKFASEGQDDDTDDEEADFFDIHAGKLQDKCNELIESIDDLIVKRYTRIEHCEDVDKIEDLLERLSPESIMPLVSSRLSKYSGYFLKSHDEIVEHYASQHEIDPESWLSSEEDEEWLNYTLRKRLSSFEIALSEFYYEYCQLIEDRIENAGVMGTVKTFAKGAIQAVKEPISIIEMFIGEHPEQKKEKSLTKACEKASLKLKNSTKRLFEAIKEEARSRLKNVTFQSVEDICGSAIQKAES